MASKNKAGGRMPNQPDGMPQGRHMTGFKGTKTDGVCLCGKCHPNAQAAVNKVVWIIPKNAKTSFVG